MKNKLIAFLMVCALAVPMLNTAVYAENDSADSRAVKLLTDLGIMDIDSYSGKFWDDTPVKRREIAQIICNLFRFEVTKDAVPRFNDVQEEYRGYVETVVRNGYMSGYSSDSFGANDYITGDQLLKIFVTVLGGQNMAELSGGFPMGYVSVAQRLGIYTGHITSEKESVRRIDVANMIYSTLETDVRILISINDKYSQYAEVKGYNFLSETLDIYRYEGIVNQNEATALDTPVGAGKDQVRIGDAVLKDEKRLTEDYLGSSVIAYVYQPDDNETGSVVSVTEAKGNEAVIIENDDFIGVNGFKLEYYDGTKKKNLTLAPGISMIYNGKATEYDPAKFTMDVGSIKLVNNNNDGMYDVVLITSYETFVVEKIDSINEIIGAKYGKDPIELEGNLYTVFRNGVPVELNKIGVGEVVLAAISDKADGERVIRIEACSNRITNTVDVLSSDEDGEYAEISGIRYRIGAYCRELMQSGILPKLSAGDTAQFFTDIYNNIAYFNLNTSGKRVGYLARSTFDEETLNETLKVRIYNDGGEFEELTANEKLKINGKSVKLSNITEELKNKLKKPQLVEYSKNEDVLTSLNFAVDGYDVNEFSLDYSHLTKGSLIKCTARTVFDYKYILTASTKIFIVPTGTTDILEPAYYYIKTSSYFNANWLYNIYLYDINENGEVRCAVIEQAPPGASSVLETDGMIAVVKVVEGLNEDGDIVPIICGFDENGKEKELIGRTEEAARVTIETNKVRDVKKGDVLQYSMDNGGKLAAIKLIHNVDEENYYQPSAIEANRSNFTVAKAYGQVIRATSSQIFLSCDGLWNNMTPIDTDMLISNTGSAVYLYDSERGDLSAATFSDVNREDNVFACVNTANKTRMLIIYR